MADDVGSKPALPKAVQAQIEAFNRYIKTDPPAPSSFHRNSPMESGPTFVPVEHYISKDFHDLEVEKLWRRVWQMACHEQDIPEVGDYLPYDIAGLSFLLVRTKPDEIKAYHNACLHRGRRLRERAGKRAKELRCQFHAWTWSLEGKLMQVPCLWDFPGLKREEQSLPEVKVGHWGGFVFINPDPNCEPFEKFIGDLSSQFELLPYEKRYKEAHVAKLLRCNWKVAQEAFMESYHVVGTHPQLIDAEYGELEGKYDVFGNYSRAIVAGALAGEAAPDWGEMEMSVRKTRHPLTGWVYEGIGDGKVKVTTPKGETGVYTWQAVALEGDLGDASLHLCNYVGGPQLPQGAEQIGLGYSKTSKAPRSILGVGVVKDGMTPAERRRARASMQREAFREIVPSIADKIADIEMTAVYYTLFPNFHPWGSFNRIVYRFRPNGDNHEECIMECMFFAPIPENGEYTPVREIHWLGLDDPWVDAPELGIHAKVFTQDVANMPEVQRGLRNLKSKRVQLADYNETKIRHFHKLLNEWVAKP